MNKSKERYVGVSGLAIENKINVTNLYGVSIFRQCAACLYIPQCLLVSQSVSQCG